MRKRKFSEHQIIGAPKRPGQGVDRGEKVRKTSDLMVPGAGIEMQYKLLSDM